MELSYVPKPTKPVTHDELVRFVKAADEIGESSLGTAAMIADYWLQREEDIITRLSWSHYRPVDVPGVARIFHHKTGKLVDIPLYDEDGTVLWPELMERLNSAPRYGTLIVTRDRLDRRRKLHLPWQEDYFRTAWQQSVLQLVLILTSSSWGCVTAAAPKAEMLI